MGFLPSVRAGLAFSENPIHPSKVECVVLNTLAINAAPQLGFESRPPRAIFLAALNSHAYNESA